MKKILLFTVLILITVPGCFFSRSKAENPINIAKIENIKVGESTMEDVARILGAPTDIIFSNHLHDPLRVFAYEYNYVVTKRTGFTVILVTFVNSDLKRDHVIVFFDDDGIVSGIGTNLFAEEASYGLPFGD